MRDLKQTLLTPRGKWQLVMFVGVKLAVDAWHDLKISWLFGWIW